MSAITAGTRLGFYEIAALLGAGGMGEVYRARDARLGRDVALKILAPRLAGNRDAVARFEQEARSASALSHPHILHIYDIGTVEIAGEALRYMTMELVDGVTLAAKIQDRSVELREILEWLAQVADGLAKAHEAGIVHRDLKPDNVMVTRDGYAKILDFGLAKLLDRPFSSEDATMAGHAPHTVAGVILGTCAYMSPEQAQGRPADARSDLFSLGAMIYEAATRRQAFTGRSTVDTLHNVIHAEPDLSALDERLARIVRRCLAKDPAARYASAKDIAHELRSKAAAQPPHSKTIAVLPFDDLSPDKGNDYFSEGLTEEITSDLSKVASLRVLSRGAVRKFRGEDKDYGRVVAELGADYVIDGSVRRAGAQLRITAQLVDARSATQLWSEKYSGTIDDVFDFQESVARSVVAQLQIKLTSRESELIAQRPMSNVEAYECYLRAARNVLRFDEAGLETALAEIEQGLALAGPNIALLAAKAYVYWQYYNLGLRPDPEYLERAASIARTIRDLDPSSPHADRLLGLVAVHRQDVRGGIEHLERALASDPNDLDAMLWLTFLGPMVGRDVQAYVDRLVAVDPLAATTTLARSFRLLMNGDFEAALPLMESIAHTESMYMLFYVLALAWAGRADTLRALRPQLEENRDGFVPALSLAVARMMTGDPADARALLTDDVLQAARGDMQYSSWIAEIYATIGDRDLALEWLEHSITRGYVPWPFFSRYDPLLAPIRDDPRFAALMERCRAAWETYQ